MSLWRFTDKKLKVGDKYEGYYVLRVEYKVPPTILWSNYNARLRGFPVEPEILQQCVQLGSEQIELPFNKE